MILPSMSSAEGDKPSERVKYRSSLKHLRDCLCMTFVSHPGQRELLASKNSTRLPLGKNCCCSKCWITDKNVEAKKWKLMFATGIRAHSRVSAPASNLNVSTFSPSVLLSRSILLQMCCARSASLQSRSNRRLLWTKTWKTPKQLNHRSQQQH